MTGTLASAGHFDKLGVMMTPFWPLVIELGHIKISSAVSLVDLLWFVGGLVLLAGSSAAVLWWSRRSRPDPFV